eukprot:14731843-Heterocapsa_arctica.AAC.1
MLFYVIRGLLFELFEVWVRALRGLFSSSSRSVVRALRDLFSSSSRSANLHVPVLQIRHSSSTSPSGFAAL